jgi:hypothetical protein
MLWIGQTYSIVAEGTSFGGASRPCLMVTREKARRCCGKYRLAIQSELGKQDPEVETERDRKCAGGCSGLRNSSADDAEQGGWLGVMITAQDDLCAVKFKGRKRKVPRIAAEVRRKGVKCPAEAPS